jgi:hypothetical protein
MLYLVVPRFGVDKILLCILERQIVLILDLGKKVKKFLLFGIGNSIPQLGIELCPLLLKLDRCPDRLQVVIIPLLLSSTLLRKSTKTSFTTV